MANPVRFQHQNYLVYSFQLSSVLESDCPQVKVGCGKVIRCSDLLVSQKPQCHCCLSSTPNNQTLTESERQTGADQYRLHAPAMLKLWMLQGSLGVCAWPQALGVQGTHPSHNPPNGPLSTSGTRSEHLPFPLNLEIPVFLGLSLNECCTASQRIYYGPGREHQDIKYHRIISPKLQVINYYTNVKGVIGCKIHFTSCLNINVCWKCVYTSIL